MRPQRTGQFLVAAFVCGLLVGAGATWSLISPSPPEQGSPGSKDPDRFHPSLMRVDSEGTKEQVFVELRAIREEIARLLEAVNSLKVNRAPIPVDGQTSGHAGTGLGPLRDAANRALLVQNLAAAKWEALRGLAKATAQAESRNGSGVLFRDLGGKEAEHAGKGEEQVRWWTGVLVEIENADTPEVLAMVMQKYGLKGQLAPEKGKD